MNNSLRSSEHFQQSIGGTYKTSIELRMQKSFTPLKRILRSPVKSELTWALHKRGTAQLES